MPEFYSTTNLIINNIPSVISDDQMTKLFSSFGAIKSCKIIRTNEKDGGKAFGFCEFIDPKSARQALVQLDNFQLNDRILKVSYAKLFPKPKGKSIEVKNLPKSTQEDTVRKYFSQFGRISRLRLIIDNEIDQQQTKTAEIVFETKSDAEKSIVKSPIKWNHDNGKQTLVSVGLIQSDRARFIRDSSINNNSGYNSTIDFRNPRLMNSNIVLINSAKQLGDNHFYLQQSAVHHDGVQQQQQQQQASPFDLTSLSSIVNCSGFPAGSIYHHNHHSHHTTAANQNAFFANFSPHSTAANFYANHPFNNLALQLAIASSSSSSSTSHPFNPNNPFDIPDKTTAIPILNPAFTAAAAAVAAAGYPTTAVLSNHSSNNYQNTNNNNSSHSVVYPPFGFPVMYAPILTPTAASGSFDPGKGGFEKPINNSNINNNHHHNHHPIKSDYSQHQHQHSNYSANSNSKSSTGSVARHGGHVLYVYNIGNSTTKEQLKDLFAPKFSKEILKVDVPKDSQHGAHNKNFGFITFGSYQKAQMAIQEMNGKEFQGKPLQVSFKK